MNVNASLLSRFADGVMLLAPEHLARFGDSSPPMAIELRRKTMQARLSQGATPAAFVPVGMFGGYWRRADGLAIAPIWGVTGPARMWCWTSYEDICAAADAIAKDGDVKAVLWHIDSPGGYASGLQPAASAIEACAAAKPSAAFADELAASCAYWLACCPGRVTAPANASLASIGAYKLHEGVVGALEAAGVTMEFIRSAPRKAEGNPFEPLSAAARAELQAEVTAAADVFISHVVRLRGVADGAVRATQGASMTIVDASAAKLADGVETFEQAAAALLARTVATPPAKPAAIPLAARNRASAKHPARGQSAQSKPRPPRARAQIRSSSMDPTTLTPEEQILRYDEIVALVAETPADDAGKIGQFVQIVGIITREAEPAEAAPEGEGEVPEGDGSAPAAAKAQRAQAISKSTEAKKYPAAAVAAIAADLSLAQFKAMAPTFATAHLAARMQQQNGSRPLGSDTAQPPVQAVKMPTSAEMMAARKKQVGAH